MSRTLKGVLSKVKQSPPIITQRHEAFMATHRNVQFSPEIALFVAQEMTKPPKDRDKIFSPSAVGGCMRAQVFRFTDNPSIQTLNTDLANIFMTGHFLHLKWQALLLQSGIITRAEVDVKHAKFNMNGTMDGLGVIPDDKIRAFPEVYDSVKYSPFVLTKNGIYSQSKQRMFGLEIKSSNDRNFGFVLRNNAPTTSHVYQVHAYMSATGLSVFSLVYENKDTGEWKEFVVLRDEAIINDVETKLATMESHVVGKSLPAVLQECTHKRGPYRYCPFRNSCLDTDDKDVTWLEG